MDKAEREEEARRNMKKALEDTIPELLPSEASKLVKAIEHMIRTILDKRS